MDSFFTFLILIAIFVAVNRSKSKTRKPGVKPPPGPAAMPKAVPVQTPAKPLTVSSANQGKSYENDFGTHPCEHQEDIFAGSMKVDSAEGKDFGHVHSNVEHGHKPPPAIQTLLPTEDEDDNGLELDFTDENQLVRAFVMQEILRRPGQ